MGALSDRKFLLFVAAFICGGLTLVLAKGTGLPPEGQRLLGALVVIMILWASSCMNLCASCLLLVMLTTLALAAPPGSKGLSLGKAFQESLSGFTSSVPIAVVGGTAFAAVVHSSGLAERIVYLIMKVAAAVGGKATPGRMLAALFIADIPASLMIPVATGRCALYMSIAEGYQKPFGFETLDSGRPFNPYQKAVWLAVALIPIIMGGAFLTGAALTIMIGGLVEQATKIPQYWSTTFFILYLPCMGSMFVSWYLLKKLFPSTVQEINADFIQERIKALGPLSYNEIYCLVALLAMIALFLTDHIHKIPASLVLVFMCAVLFIPGIGPGNWKKEGKKASWEGYFIIGSALGFSSALGKYKVMNYFAGKISALGMESLPLVLIVMVAATLVIRLGIASITSAAALLVPISMVVSAAAKLDPMQTVAVAWVTYAFCRISFFLPHQGAQLIMTYGMGYYEVKDLTRAACWITPACAVIYIVWATFFVVPLIKLVS